MRFYTNIRVFTIDNFSVKKEILRCNFGRFFLIIIALILISSTNVVAQATDATLSNLTISSGSLNQPFVPSTTSYTVGVRNSTTNFAVTPTTNDVNATVTVNGTAVTSCTASGPIALLVGPNTITTVVTAQDGTTTQT